MQQMKAYESIRDAFRHSPQPLERTVRRRVVLDAAVCDFTAKAGCAIPFVMDHILVSNH